ncbi:MAG: 30S ribosomal protein S17 [Candidatus Hodarchaeales archaeon]
MGRDIGFAPAPTETCEDENCPFHGTLAVRGKVLEGTVVNDENGVSITVERSLLVQDKKYKRYFRKFSRIAAHNPPCIDAKAGDRVRIGECRKISKTIAFVVIEKILKIDE